MPLLRPPSGVPHLNCPLKISQRVQMGAPGCRDTAADVRVVPFIWPGRNFVLKWEMAGNCFVGLQTPHNCLINHRLSWQRASGLWPWAAVTHTYVKAIKIKTHTHTRKEMQSMRSLALVSLQIMAQHWCNCCLLREGMRTLKQKDRPTH